MIAVALVILLVLFMLLRPLLAAWLYARPRRQSPPPPAPHAGYEAVSFGGGAAPCRTGWFRPSGNGAAVILLHNHGGDRGDVLPPAEALAAAGYGVLLAGLRAHGESDYPHFSRAGAVEDALAAVTWLLRHDDAPARIGLLGAGLGGTVALQAAARSKHVHAVAAASPTPAALDDLPPPGGVVDLLWRTPQEYLFLSAVDRFAGAAHLSPNTRALARLAGRAVWLGSAGRGREQRHTRHLFAAARRPKSLYESPDARPAYGLTAPDDYAVPLLDFFNQALAPDSAPPAGRGAADAATDTPTTAPQPADEKEPQPAGERTVTPATAMMIAFAAVPVAMLGLIAPFQLRWGLTPPRLPVGQPIVAILGFVGLLLAGLLLREGVHLAAYYVIGRVPRGAARLGGTGAGLTPRVRCAVLLPARAYRAILLAPGVLLGVVPGIAGIVVGSWLLIIWALWMLVAAGGDLAALWAMRGLPAAMPVRAHPARPGCEFFTRDEYVQNIDNRL